MADEKPEASKSEFIRNQPTYLHAADVVANAREAGLTIDLPLVYKVRGRAAATRKAATAAAATSAAAARGASIVDRRPPAGGVHDAATSAAAARGASKTAPPSKADFVRARPHRAPKQIVEQARLAGIEIEPGYLSNVRGAGKAKKLAARKPASPLAPSSPARSSEASEIRQEELLKIVAAEVGLGRAIEVLAGERAKVTALIGR